ncbi:MAG: hypothetical protein H6835_12700 [Planctomycetes bacterium]|nr:hypothetical protein [Planctomycetota bacterium]
MAGAPPASASLTATGTGCIDYDVLMRCADGVDLLDVPRALQSLQLNPRCVPIATEATTGLRTELERLEAKARQTLGRRYAEQGREMHALIAAGRLPQLDASLHPEVYRRTLRVVERSWRRLHPTLVEQPDWRDQPGFLMEFRNRLSNALFEHTDYKVTTIVNGGTWYAARYQDLPGFCTAMLDGEYEALATEAWAALLAFFHARNALTDAERDDLWARFATVLGEYSQQAAAIYR